MPYIKPKLRGKYKRIIEQIKKIDNKGDLEYCISLLQHIFMDTREFKYSTLHECVYATQHCADEFRRRFLDKREDEAREKNGDIE